MSVQIGVVTKDKFRTWEMKSLALAARRAGAGMTILDPSSCPLDLAQGALFELRDASIRVDACLGRVDPGCLESGVRLLEIIEQRIPVLNGAQAFRLGRDKRSMSLAFARAGVPHPPTWLVPPQRIPSLIRRLPFPLVVKPPTGSEGKGVVLVKGARRLLELAQKAQTPLYLQAFCKIQSELRVLVLDGAALGAVLRRPQSGEWRGNLALGALAEAVPVDDTWSRLAVNAAAAVGADFAGVDLALTDEGATVLEANVCPGFRGFSRLTGVDVAARLIEALIARTQKEGADCESAAAHGQKNDNERP